MCERGTVCERARHREPGARLELWAHREPEHHVHLHVHGMCMTVRVFSERQSR